MQKIIFILRRNISFKNPPSEVASTSADKLMKNTFHNFEKVLYKKDPMSHLTIVFNLISNGRPK